MAKPGTAAVVRSPADSKRAGANQARLTERTVRIAREVDRVADELDVTSAQVAVAWVRQHQRECGRHLVPVVGARTTEQLRDLLGSLHVELPAGQAVRLEEVSRIELGFPYELLRGPQGQMVYGDLEPRIELPAAAPIRW